MMLTEVAPTQVLYGSTQPRIAPPAPLRSALDDWRAAAAVAKIDPLDWQLIGARYLMATKPDGSWLYPDVCIVGARQNGKTKLLVPRILDDLRKGRRVLHTAHRMRLTVKVFRQVAMIAKEVDGAKIRWQVGMEEIYHPSGGTYAPIAALRGARGDSGDTLIVDEVREFEDTEAMEATGPTLAASHNPQTIFLSNAGSSASLVLNSLRRRGEEEADDTLAYLEWSASPERSIDDVAGWQEANPAMGHFPEMLSFLHKQRKAYQETPAVFETEHLSRWVDSMQPKLVSEAAWQSCRGDVSTPERPSIAFNMDPQGRRASAAMAWTMADGRVALVEVKEAEGAPIDVDLLGRDLKALTTELRARKIGFASWTDSALARYMPRAAAVDGKEYANASVLFSQLVNTGRLVWADADHISEDLSWTSRKPHDSGSWMAVPATPERPITSVLAAIRAVYLAAAPRPTVPRIG